MPRVVPSQVVSLIDSIGDFSGPMDRRNMEQADAAELSALVTLIDEIPGELLTLDHQRYKALLSGKARVLATIESRDRAQRLGPFVDPILYAAISGIRDALSGCPDQAPAPTTSELKFIVDPDLRENLRNDIGVVERALLMLQEDVARRSPQLRATLLTFLFTGLRISDVRRFPVTALDFKNNRIKIKTQKRGKIVSLSIHPELRAALEVHLAYRNQAQQGSTFVFSTMHGKVNESLDAELRRLFKRCGTVGGRPHRFRDTFAVRLLAQGASLYDVAKMLGINMKTAEDSYAPYVKELQERGAGLISSLS
jgi:integrase